MCSITKQSTNAAVASGPGGPKHLKSCARCRKHKTKCNYSLNAPGACSSCEKRGLSCHFETVFQIKRSNIIKNLASDIDCLKMLVNELITRESVLKLECVHNGIEIEGLSSVPLYDLEEIPQSPLEDASPSELGSSPMFSSSSSSCSLIQDQMFCLDGISTYSYHQVSSLFASFNQSYLHFLPIFDQDEIRSFHDLINNEPLTFWTIIFILTKNTPIYDQYIHKFIVENIRNPNFQLTRSVLLLSCFPTRTSASSASTSLGSFDKYTFELSQWVNSVTSWVEQQNDLPFNNEIKSLLFTFNTFINVQLGIKRDSNFEICHSNGYCYQLYEVSSLMSKILNSSHMDCTNWENELDLLRSSNKEALNFNQIDCLDAIYSFVPMLINLLYPMENKFKFVDICITQSELTFNIIEKIDLNISPITNLIILQTLSLTMFKILYSPFNKNMNIFQIQFVSSVFNKCLNFIEYNNMRPILNIIMDFDSNLKLDSSMLRMTNFDSFKAKHIQGLIDDLKFNCLKYEQEDPASKFNIPSTKEFELNKIDFNSFLNSFNWIRSNLDLIILFSNKMFHSSSPQLSTNTESSSVASVSPNMSHHSIELATTATTASGTNDEELTTIKPETFFELTNNWSNNSLNTMTAI